MIEDESPLGGATAYVEDDGRTVWLYVRGEGRKLAAWLGNRVPAPESDDPHDWEAGAAGWAPRLARDAVAHRTGRGPLVRPSILWLDNGEDVLVLEDGDVLGGLVGGIAWARDTRKTTAWARPLEGAILERRHAAEALWPRWRGPMAANTWSTLRDAELVDLARTLGPHEEYLAVDAGRFPPLAVARFGQVGFDVFCTVGAATFAMPGGGARLRLAVAARDSAGWAPQVLAWLARWPWRHGLPLGDGSVVVAPTLNASWLAPDTSGVLLTASPPTDGGRHAPPLDPGWLWVLPLTLDELRSAEALGGQPLARTLADRGRSYVTR